MASVIARTDINPFAMVDERFAEKPPAAHDTAYASGIVRLRPWGLAAWLCLGIFAVILWLYSPALNGHFIFDDLALPFCKPIRHASLLAWISDSGVRPVLMISYWLNYQISGDRPFSCIS